MIQDPPSSRSPFSASAPSSSSPSPYAARGDVERDQDHKIDDELQSQLEHLRGSFDERAAELGRRTAKVREALDFSEHIREQPMLAIGLGAAAGALTALIRPNLRSGLLAVLAMRASREVASRVLERVFHMLVDGQQARQAIDQERPIHSRGYSNAIDLG
jgi:ElaB/YqjD/DUF883 family membrane-anchored ribosome-binding protein